MNKTMTPDEIRDMTYGFPLYCDENKQFIYTENFNDYVDDGYEYHIGYSTYEPNEEEIFIVKFEGTKTYCVQQLHEWLKENVKGYK